MTDKRIRLRFVAPLRPKTAPGTLTGDIAFLPMEAIGEDGTYDRDSVRQAVDVVDSGYTYFEQGDVVRARVTPCFENGKGAWLSTLRGGRGLGTTELFVFRPSQHLDARFLYYVMASEEFNAQGAATMYGAHGVRRVDEQFARNYRVWVPPVDQQGAIADYLDRETARIDTLITAKRRMLALLNERAESSAAALVEHATAAGPQVPLWTLMQPTEITGAEGLEVLSVYRDYGVIPKASRSDNYNKTPEDLSRYQVVAPGDVVVNKMKAWQGSIGVSEFRGIVSPDYLVCRVVSGVNSLYLHHVLRSPQLRTEFQRRSEGIRPSQWRLQWDQMRLIVLPVPDAKGQTRAVENHAREVDRLQQLGLALVQQLRLLAARRQALITAAVTGQPEIAEAT